MVPTTPATTSSANDVARPTSDEAAKQIFSSLTDEGYSLHEIIEITRQLGTVIRIKIDDDMQKLQALRASF